MNLPFPSEETDAAENLQPPQDMLALPDEAAKSAPWNVAAKLGRLLLDLYQLAMTSPIGEFEAELFLLLQEYLAFDAAWLGKSTMVLEGPKMHNSYLYKLPDSYVRDWEQVKIHDTFVPRVIRSPGRAATLSLADASIEPSFRTFLGRYAVAQACCCVSEDPFLKLWTHLSVYRNSFLPPFAAQEIELFELAMPHLASALNLNRVHHMQQLKAAKLTPRESFAISDSLGVLQYADAVFADLMLMEWPEWNRATLPRTFRLLQSEKSANVYVGKLITLQAEPVSDLLLINAKPRSAIDVLTPRELAVVRLYGEGLTYKAVAKKLAISPATVRHHLRQAYAKLQIQNKGEIAWLLSRSRPA